MNIRDQIEAEKEKIRDAKKKIKALEDMLEEENEDQITIWEV